MIKSHFFSCLVKTLVLLFGMVLVCCSKDIAKSDVVSTDYSEQWCDWRYANPYDNIPDKGSAFARVSITKIIDEEILYNRSECILVEATINHDFYNNHFDGETIIISFYTNMISEIANATGEKEFNIKEQLICLLNTKEEQYFFLDAVEQHSYDPEFGYMTGYYTTNGERYYHPTISQCLQQPINLLNYYSRWLYIKNRILDEQSIFDILVFDGIEYPLPGDGFYEVWRDEHFHDGMTIDEVENQIIKEYVDQLN